MADEITIVVNGKRTRVCARSTVAAAVVLANDACRLSLSGAPRGPLCGMGICFECRVSINGVAHCRSCQILCREGMQVRTDA
jgi:aerobic-type carbon monoxide dehydrogenase small subunit (CoxS/CutS family)